MFKDPDSAEKAYKTLESKGYNKDHVHLAMSHGTRDKHFSNKINDTHHKESHLATKAAEDAKNGAAVGIGLGAMIGAIAAIGTSILLPGIGLLVSGSFIAALAGAGAGGVAGGLIGGLVGSGIPEEHAKKYEHGIKNGHIVMGIHPRNAEDAKHIEEEWRKHNGTEIYNSPL
jgi:hypothetical protein